MQVGHRQQALVIIVIAVINIAIVVIKFIIINIIMTMIMMCRPDTAGPGRPEVNAGVGGKASSNGR